MENLPGRINLPCILPIKARFQNRNGGIVCVTQCTVKLVDIDVKMKSMIMNSKNSGKILKMYYSLKIKIQMIVVVWFCLIIGKDGIRELQEILSGTGLMNTIARVFIGCCMEQSSHKIRIQSKKWRIIVWQIIAVKS